MLSLCVHLSIHSSLPSFLITSPPLPLSPPSLPTPLPTPLPSPPLLPPYSPSPSLSLLSQHFTTPDSMSCTKMGLEDIAMVWAPNILRCPSDDHKLVAQNAKKEMAFLCLLLKYLDTDSS